MPKARRPENKKLPTRWRFYHGAYFYQVPRGLEAQWDGKRHFRLGTTLPEAYRTWAERLQAPERGVHSIGQLLDRYSLEVVPTKAPKTQAANHAAITRLRAVFGEMSIPALEPVHVQEYLDRRRAHPIAANREVEVLSAAYSKAVRWGLAKAHPMKGKIEYHPEPPRNRYVEDRELAEALKVANPTVRAYIGVKFLTGLRRTDILQLRVGDLKDDGIHVQPSKTSTTTRKRLIIEWTDALHQAVDQALATRPKDIAPWVFCTRRGEPYIKPDGTANAFDSLWQRFMDKALKETGLTERFQEKDLRAKTASDMPLELATALLGHADARLTQRVYRRRPDRVKPLR